MDTKEKYLFVGVSPKPFKGKNYWYLDTEKANDFKVLALARKGVNDKKKEAATLFDVTTGENRRILLIKLRIRVPYVVEQRKFRTQRRILVLFVKTAIVQA